MSQSFNRNSGTTDDDNFTMSLDSRKVNKTDYNAKFETTLIEDKHVLKYDTLKCTFRYVSSLYFDENKDCTGE